MGEAKRRRETDRERYRFKSADDPDMRAIFEKKGDPIHVALIGSAVIFKKARSCSINFKALDPESAAVRRAFGLWDRIRTGEVETWVCVLCGKQHVGLGDLSCFGVIIPFGATPNTKGIIVVVCHRCDSVSTEHTKRRITALFPMEDAGRA